MDTYHLNKVAKLLIVFIMFIITAQSHAVNDSIFPGSASVQSSYTLSNTVLTIDDTLNITRTFINNEATPLTCFYFCDNLPDEFTIISHAVTINSSPVSYDFPTATASTYTNFSEYYFVLDYPGTHGTYDLLIQPDDTVVVEYQVICSSVNSYALPLHTFIAHNGTTGIFGHADSLTMQFGVSLDINDEINLPNSFTLAQNYPNPFNPTTTIEFSLPEKSFVTIIVYNTIGQKVATILEKQLSAGTHQTVWNGMTSGNIKAPTGVYLYKLQTENREISKKMLLLK